MEPNKDQTMDASKKLSNFVREVKARLKGDTEEVVAAKNERKAHAAIEGQISALKSKLVDKEDKLEEAKEALGNAIYPTELIANSESYVQGIQRAQSAVDTAQDDLDSFKKSIEFYTDLLKDKF